MNARWIQSVLISAVVLTGCGGGSTDAPAVAPASTDAFPLAAGDHWEMKGENARFGAFSANHDTTSVVQLDTGPAYVQKRGEVPSAYRRTSTEVLTWQGNDLSTPEMRAIAPTLYLKLPLTVGDEWNGVNQTTAPAGATYKTVTTGSTKVVRTEPVTTPAGTFNAFVVQTNSDYDTTRLADGGLLDWGRYGRTEWFVLGIGLVKYSDSRQGLSIFGPSGISYSLTAYRLAERRN